MLDVSSTNDAKSRDKRSANMGDPKADAAASDAVSTDPVTVAAREAIRAPVGSREGSVLMPGEGWGRNMTLKPEGDWHGTRDGKGCRGVPATEPDPSRGLVRGQCPECRAKFEKEEPTAMAIETDPRKLAETETKIIVEPKHGVQLSRERQRLEISRQILARKTGKVSPENRDVMLRDPEFRAAFDDEVRKAYKNAGL